MDRFWEELVQRADVYVGRIVGAAVILVVGVLALRYLVAPFRRVLERGKLEPSAASFLANSVRALLFIVIIIGVLQQLGVETASLLTVLAAGGIAVALSLQTTLANFTAGIVLLSFRMIRIGDLIETGTMRGRVSEILPFHVVLLAEDNQVITVPNLLLTTNGFRNFSGQLQRRAQWMIPLRAGDDLAGAFAALRTRLLADPRILREPPPHLFVQEWADDKRIVAIQAWATSLDLPAVQEEMLETLGRALEAFRGKPESSPLLTPQGTVGQDQS